MLTGQKNTGLPDTVFGNFPRNTKSVVIFLIDGFGWRYAEPLITKNSFFGHLTRQGVLSKLTTQFPSSTPPQVTAIHTGLPVGESGIYEWFYYEKQLDAVIAPLKFSYAGDKEQDTLLRDGVDPRALFPTMTVYQKLREYGISSRVYLSAAYASSPYSRVAIQGANVVPYTTLPEGLASLANAVRGDKEKSYTLFYYDAIDAAGHVYGPNAPETATAIETCMESLEKVFFPALHGAQDTTLLFTADHGHVVIRPEATVYINEVLPRILPYLQNKKDGKPIAPAGSCRDFFLHVNDEHVERVTGILKDFLRGKAEVHLVSDLIRQGIFGKVPPLSPFLEHVGNVVVLPYANESVWWREGEKFQVRYHGHHGGLTPEEMEIPFLVVPLGG